MMPSLGAVLSRRSRVQLAALLKVQAKLSLREPYGVGLGLGFPVSCWFSLASSAGTSRGMWQAAA